MCADGVTNVLVSESKVQRAQKVVVQVNVQKLYNLIVAVVQSLSQINKWMLAIIIKDFGIFSISNACC